MRDGSLRPPVHCQYPLHPNCCLREMQNRATKDRNKKKYCRVNQRDTPVSSVQADRRAKSSGTPHASRQCKSAAQTQPTHSSHYRQGILGPALRRNCSQPHGAGAVTVGRGRKARDRVGVSGEGTKEHQNFMGLHYIGRVDGHLINQERQSEFA